MIKTHLDHVAPTKKKAILAHVSMFAAGEGDGAPGRARAGPGADPRLGGGESVLVGTGVRQSGGRRACLGFGVHFASSCGKFSQNSIVSKHCRPSSISVLSKSQVCFLIICCTYNELLICSQKTP